MGRTETCIRCYSSSCTAWGPPLTGKSHLAGRGTRVTVDGRAWRAALIALRGAVPSLGFCW